MPFVAEKNGERVVPTQVEDGGSCVCLECGNELRVRKAHYRGDTFVARHFFHDGVECPGESDEHLRMKTIAHSKLEDKYPDAVVNFEEKVDTERTENGRRADILVKFDSPRDNLGKGIAVEVQYKNKGKDVDAVERDYLRQEYSVLWLHERDFSDRNVCIRKRDIIQFYPNVIPTSKPKHLYPDYPEAVSHEVDISPPSEADILPPRIREEITQGYLEGKEKQILNRRENNFPEENGEWQNGIVNVQTSNRGELSLSMTPDGEYVMKAEDSYGKSVHIKVLASEKRWFRSNAEKLYEKVMDGTIKNIRQVSEPGSWDNLTDGRFESGQHTTAWVTPSINPKGELCLTVGKKYRETESVVLQISEEDIDGLSSFFTEVHFLLKRLEGSTHSQELSSDADWGETHTRRNG